MFSRSLSQYVLACFFSPLFLLGGCKTLKSSNSIVCSDNTSEQQQLPITPEIISETPQCDPKIITRTSVIYQPVNIGQKLVIGVVESVTFENLNIMLPARIDTGAATSSLCATDIHPFERDGRHWVSFRLHDGPDDKDGLLVKRQIVRHVMIKRHHSNPQQRPVVRLKMRIGKIEEMAEFTLADRRNFEFPVLIGRNILADIAIVDASYDYLVSKKKIIHGKQP